MSVLCWYRGTLANRAVSTVTILRKTVHIPWYNEEGHAVKEPQNDYSVPHLKGRLLPPSLARRACSSHNPIATAPLKT
jgi:hypothetical protein